ncbi:MAG: polysaccharide (de)acetylase [Actinomycetia bacterium]|nr:polysaccharide (de)acetylase [Actinomycetes bacterium]
MLAARIARRFRALGLQRVVDRPTVVFASDDWGLLGVPDATAFDRIRRRFGETGLFDTHSLETVDDLAAIGSMFARHRDADGCPPVLSAFYVMRNIDPAASLATGRLVVRAIDEGDPNVYEDGWWEATLDAVDRGVIAPYLHGRDHADVGRLEAALQGGDGADVVRDLFASGVGFHPHVLRFGAYAHEHSDLATDLEVLTEGKVLFERAFGRPATVTCPPGYRMSSGTLEAMARLGIMHVHNGGGPTMLGPVVEDGVLHVPRNVSFEPAIRGDQVTAVLPIVHELVRAGFPVVLSTHAVNFQTRLVDHRAPTLDAIDAVCTELEQAYPDLRYVSAEALRGQLRRPGLRVRPRRAVLRALRAQSR